MLTAKEKSFDKGIVQFENEEKIKLFDYSQNNAKETFGYLVYEKNLYNLFQSPFFQRFYESNKNDINFIDVIKERYNCYPPVLGIKYNCKNIESIGIYSNPPIDVKDYMKNYIFIRNEFNSLYNESNYKLLCENFLDDIIFSQKAYLFLFGFDITEQTTKKHKFYLKLESKECIENIFNFMTKNFSFKSDFLTECLYGIPKKNNCYVDIIAFSFVDNQLCLNIYYKSC